MIAHQGRAPTWSPSGRWITYESSSGSPPVWSPDGSQFAVSFHPPSFPQHTGVALLRVALPNGPVD